MNVSPVPLARSRQILTCLAVGTLAGCMIIPGNQAYSHRDESDVRLPIQQGDTLVPANVKIKPITAVKPITAELIIDLFKAARPPVGDGTSSAKAAEKNNPRPSSDKPAAVPEYRLGPGDIISIIVWDHPELTNPPAAFVRPNKPAP